MLLDEYIQNFLIYLQTQRRYSERTVDTYRKSLEKYLATLAGNTPLEAFTEMSVKNFVWELKIKQKLAPTSICEHLAALKSFGKYLVRSKILQKNPAETVPMPKRPKRLVQFLGLTRAHLRFGAPHFGMPKPLLESITDKRKTSPRHR